MVESDMAENIEQDFIFGGLYFIFRNVWAAEIHGQASSVCPVS